MTRLFLSTRRVPFEVSRTTSTLSQGFGHDGAEAYLDLERTPENLASGGRESRQGFGNRVDNQVSFHRPVAAVEH